MQKLRRLEGAFFASESLPAEIQKGAKDRIANGGSEIESDFRGSVAEMRWNPDSAL